MRPPLPVSTMTISNPDATQPTGALLSEYFQLAITSIIKAFLICTGIFMAIMLAIMLLLHFTKPDNANFDIPHLLDAAPTGLFWSVGLSLFIVALAIYTEVVELQRFRMAFAQPPFSELATRGFEPGRIFEHSLWKLYKEVRVFKLDRYIIVADQPIKGSINFTVLTGERLESVPVLPKGQKGFTLGKNAAGLTITVGVNDVNAPSGSALMQLFEVAVNWLNGQGHTPNVGLRRYESMIKAELMVQGIKGGLGG